MNEVTELYGGAVICEFNPVRHTYTIVNRGRRYKAPSVTRITSILDKPALIPWAINSTLEVCKGAINAGTEYSESYLEQVWKAAKGASGDLKREAADRGKAKHKEIEELVASGQGSPEGIASFAGLAAERVVSVERRIYSRRFRYSGTLDCLAVVRQGDDRKLVLIDWKTSKSIYPEFRLQTAAYVHAYEEEHPDQKIEGRYLVRIGEDGSIEPHYYPRSTLRKDFQAFLGALALYHRVQTIEKENRKLLKTKTELL